MSEALLKMKTLKVQLPSLGLPYNQAALINGDSVVVRNYLMEDQRECSSAAASSNIYNFFKLLLDRFLQEPKSAQFKTDDLLMSDILAIMYTIKAASWGDIFTISHFKCSGCGGTESPKLSMAKFDVLYADEVENYKATGIVYNLAGHEVTCHLPTLGDENKVYLAMKDLRKTKGIKNPLLDESLMRVAQTIDTVDGKEQPLLLKFESLLKLPPEECEKLGDALSDMDTGILLDTFEVPCPKCKLDNSDEVDLGFNPYFFRAPELDGGASEDKDKTKHSRKLQLSRHSFHDPARVEEPVRTDGASV